MRLFPLDHYTVRTKLSRDKAEGVIAGQLEAKGFLNALQLRFGVKKSNKILAGKVGRGRFSVKPNGNHSPLYPVLKGSIEADGDGCIVKVQSRVNLFAIIFLAVILFFIYITVEPNQVFPQQAQTWLQGKVSFQDIVRNVLQAMGYNVPVKLGITGIMYVLVVLGYGAEAENAKLVIERLLTAGTRNDEDERPAK